MVKNRKSFGVSIILLLAFMLWTIVVCTVDVQPIGPRGSSVGLASMNRLVHRLTGVYLSLYNITDWLGLVPAGICAGFGMLGLAQWIRRKSLRKVDFSIRKCMELWVELGLHIIWMSFGKRMFRGMR